MKNFSFLADKKNMYIFKSFYLYIAVFILFFTYVFAESGHRIKEDMDEIDIEIMKYIKSLNNEKDQDEEKLNTIFGPPLNEDINASSTKKNHEYSFNNINSKYLEENFKRGNIKNYTVKSGDTLYSIAKQHRMSIQELYQLNPEITNKPLFIGDTLKVYDIKQNYNTKNWIEKQEVDYQLVKYQIKQGDTLYSIAKKFGTDVKTLKNLNGLKDKSILKPNQTIIISKTKIIKNYKVRKLFIKPVQGDITSGFGYRRNPFIPTIRHFHKGIDISAEIGTPIYAARDGLVIFSGRMEGFGNCIFIRHQEGYITVYGHNKVNYVKVGDIVRQGQVIGEVGRTGFATGPHLHFEVRKLDQPINPIIALNLEERIELSTKRIALK